MERPVPVSFGAAGANVTVSALLFHALYSTGLNKADNRGGNVDIGYKMWEQLMLVRSPNQRWSLSM